MKGAETCDDGNKVAGDGCSTKCAVETGYNCDAKNGDGSSKCVKEV
jgi:cysteine-rich repeat protein